MNIKIIYKFTVELNYHHHYCVKMPLLIVTLSSQSYNVIDNNCIDYDDDDDDDDDIVRVKSSLITATFIAFQLSVPWAVVNITVNIIIITIIISYCNDHLT